MPNIKLKQIELRKNINGIKTVIRKPIESKLNFQLTLLILILFVVIFPYLVKGYSKVIEIKKQEENRKIQEAIEKTRQIIFGENQARQNLLKKYDISTQYYLDLDYPCNSEYECKSEIKITKDIYDYLFGELRDKRLSTTDQCNKIQDKYIRYCPTDPFGLCELQESEPTTSPSYSLTQELKAEGFDLALLPKHSFEGDSFGMGKCNRMNIEKNVNGFIKNTSKIDKMISENQSHPMIQVFSERYYKNYKLLENELKNADTTQ